MKYILSIVISSVLTLNAAAQIEYTGGTYTQNFNGLQNDAIYTNYTTLPTGWQVSHGSYVWTNGTTGYSNNYGTYAFASATSSIDKSLSLVVGSTGQAYFGAQLLNTTDHALTSFTLSYYAEQWVIAAVTASDQSIPFEYSIGATSLTSGTYISVASLTMHSIYDGDGNFSVLDGNSSQNRTLILFTVTGIDWEPNQDLWLRWDGVSLPFSSSHAMAVDDLSFSAVPEPRAFILTIVGLIMASACFRVSRTRRCS